jgi:hypothetical protein
VSTEVGLVDLARALAVGPYDASALVGQQISGSRIATSAISSIDRSQLQIVPNDNIMVWVRYTDDDDAALEQSALQIYAMDLSAKRWCSFTGWEQPSVFGGATAIGVCDNRLFIGDSEGYLNEYTLTGSQDSVGHAASSPTAVLYYGQCAYTDMGLPAIRKQVSAINVIADADTGTATVNPSTIGVYEDFQNSASGSELFRISQPLTLANQRGEEWYRVFANGFRVSISWAFNTTTGGTLTRARWYACDLMLKSGGDQ